MNRNKSGNAYALTMLCPIKPGFKGNRIYADLIRDRLESWNLETMSPLAKVPNTYLSRLLVLDDLYTESLPGANFWDSWSDIRILPSNEERLAALPHTDHLQSRYLVFSSNLHGDLDTYLSGMWQSMEAEIKSIWQYCYGFEAVNDALSFVAYAHKCCMDASLFFVGSNDDSLADQLKALYVKQQFSKFAQATQDLSAAQLKQAYVAFMQRIKPRDINHPTWKPGVSNAEIVEPKLK
jgi:hypothetical protein